MAKYKPWASRDWLIEEYVKRKKTIDVIARECTEQGISVTPMTIYNALVKFELIKNQRDLGKRSVGKNTGNKRRGFYG